MNFSIVWSAMHNNHTILTPLFYVNQIISITLGTVVHNSKCLWVKHVLLYNSHIFTITYRALTRKEKAMHSFRSPTHMCPQMQVWVKSKHKTKPDRRILERVITFWRRSVFFCFLLLLCLIYLFCLVLFCSGLFWFPFFVFFFNEIKTLSFTCIICKHRYSA